MSLSLFSLVGPAMNFAGLQDLLTDKFWIALYSNGNHKSWLLVLIRLLVAVLILLAARVVVQLVHRMLAHGIAAAAARSGQAQRRLSTLQGLLASALSYTVYFIALILILFNIGLTWKALAPLLGLASVIGLAIGFGAQKLVRDVITGLFILGEGQFDVGDWVTIGSVTGVVEDIGLRITRICDDQGRIYVIANGDITQVFNASRGLTKLSMDIALQRTLPLDEGLALIKSAAEETLQEFGITNSGERENPTLIVTGMEAAKVVVRVVLWTPVRQRDAIEHALRRRLLHVIAQGAVGLALA